MKSLLILAVVLFALVGCSSNSSYTLSPHSGVALTQTKVLDKVFIKSVKDNRSRYYTLHVTDKEGNKSSFKEQNRADVWIYNALNSNFSSNAYKIISSPKEIDRFTKVISVEVKSADAYYDERATKTNLYSEVVLVVSIKKSNEIRPKVKIITQTKHGYISSKMILDEFLQEVFEDAISVAIKEIDIE